MNSVIATRVSRHPAYGVQARERFGGASYAGYLLMIPEVGKPLMIFFDSAGRHLRTSPVKRVLMSCKPKTVYIETQNSTYCVRGEVVEEL